VRNPFARIRTEHLLLLGSVVATFAATLLFAQRPRSLGHDPKNEKQGSSRYSSPLGGKAFYTLLEALGHAPFRHDRALGLLPESSRELVMLGLGKAPSDPEVEELRDWVTRGGTLVWCRRRGSNLDADDPILKVFGLRLVGFEDDANVELPASLGPLDRRETRSYTISASRGPRLEAAGGTRGAEALAGDDEGWVAAIVPRGEGRLLALSDPGLVANGSISRADNAEFMVRMADIAARGGPIAFDEFHHGFTEGQSAFAILWGSSLRAVLLLGVAAVFCGVFAAGRRLGPAVDVHEERRRRPAEFIEAFAGLCRKRKAGPQALSMVLSEFRLYLQQAHGAATPEAIGRVSARAGLDPQAVAATIERATRLSKAATADDAAFVSCCRQLETVRSTLRRNQVMRNAP
jgi:hypothetical protein